MLPTKFQVNWLLGLGEEVKKRFSRWPSWISDQQDFSYFDLQVTLMLPTKSGVNWPFGSGYVVKNRFSRWQPWQPSWISAIFDLQVTLMLPTKLRVNWHLGLGEEVKNRFSRWPPWRPSWIYDQHDFSYFWFTSHPNASCQVSSPGLSVQEKRRKIAFQDGSHGAHLGFPIGTILAIFDLQVILMLPTKFRVNWLLGLGEEAKNWFSRWLPWRPSWIYNRHDFSYFWSTSHPNVSYIQLAF